ncbi:MAG: PVC-type heme-binding CxxCH protein [Opitutus sp.]
MKFPLFAALSLVGLPLAADTLTTRNPNPSPPAASSAAIDPVKDLPRFLPVEARDAVATWTVKPGFKLQLAAHEPQVRDPIAITFDENGRMFVCEMIDYSERRDAHPHLGRISLLEDKDGDGIYETSTVFADDLPLPTGLIWANGGLFVAATPDIWRFADRDGDGRAEVREKIYTGFGTGLKAINVQAMLNSLAWGQDNRIRVQGGLGNRGVISSPKRPDLPAEELASRDFWFDPRTYAFGFEAGGGQYGMSFDNYGRRFVCSNSDHLQFFVYDERYASRNPFFVPPPARQSIAADGGAAEVFRLSPDEPWRIVRTRWRIGGVVKGMVEGGGRVSGYFTGATGTTVFRGDAYGDDFLNNTFTGDAGGQLVHRKKIHADGVSLVGRRPADEQGYEFAASKDSWVRVVNFANAPDGALLICDMYREVIEHPWSIPEEIKQHLDLNHGNTRGRLYRLVPDNSTWQRRTHVALGSASTAELVATLAHSNGWHRDTAARLLYERQDVSAVPLLVQLFREASSPLAQHHALGVLDGLGALTEEPVLLALASAEPRLREHAILYAEKLISGDAPSPALIEKLSALTSDADARVRFQLAFTISTSPALAAAYAQLALQEHTDAWISAALLTGSPAAINATLFPAFTRDFALAKAAAPFIAHLIEIRAASSAPADRAALIEWVAQPDPSPLWLRALGDGLRRVGTSIAAADTAQKLTTLFVRAATTAADEKSPEPARLAAIALLEVATYEQSSPALIACLAAGQPAAVQSAAIKALAQNPSPAVTAALIKAWPHYAVPAREAALSVLIAREDRATALLAALSAGEIKPAELPATQVQSLVLHKNPKIAAAARHALTSVIPRSRAEVTATFRPSLALPGDASRGHTVYQGRCVVCHRVRHEGVALGPDLITVKSKGREALLTAILEPHREVAPNYIAYDVATKDGNAYTGIFARDDATGLTLKVTGGAEITLSRANIRGSSSTGQSLMPEGLEAGLSVRDMADLLTFIETLK